MVQPRVFVSSTFYDLKHIRSSLKNFIDSMGFETILAERGNIAFSPMLPLDESCYKEVGNSDIFIIIIGGRYGSERSGSEHQGEKNFFDRYDSITKTEYTTAIEKNIPIYILIEKSVYADYETFLRNKNNKLIDYAHVESVNIFLLIEYILSQSRNNPIHQFDRYSDIEVWLKEQWAGLFRDLINQQSKQIQITSLANQISQLEEINKTQKHYLEEIISKMLPEISGGLIDGESKRLKMAVQIAKLEKNYFFKMLNVVFGIHVNEYYEAITSSESVEDFFEHIQSILDTGETQSILDTDETEMETSFNFSSEDAKAYLREPREDLNLEPLVLGQKNNTKFILEIKRNQIKDCA